MSITAPPEVRPPTAINDAPPADSSPRHDATDVLKTSEAPVDSSRKIYALLKGEINPWQEELWIVALNGELQVLQKSMIFRGTAESCQFHPRDIFRNLILANASCFAMAHNHPSGNATPSTQDEEITFRMSELGKLMEIPLVDHLILCERIYYSFADAKNLSGKIRRRRRGRA